MKVNWKAVSHPSVPNATWTLIAPDSRGTRKSLIIMNEDPTVTFRVSPTLAAPSAAGAGFPLYGGGDGVWQMDYDGCYDGPVWAYQASGGVTPLETLGVMEGF